MPKAGTISDRRPAPIRLFNARDHAGPAAALAALMILSALTEGIGIVLLVPMLGAINVRQVPGSFGQVPGGRIAGGLAALGVPLQIGPLLALFVALVVLRAAINHHKAIVALKFESNLVDGLRRRAWHALLHCDWRVVGGMRQSDIASLLITTFDRIGFGVDQAVAALAAAVTLAGIAAAAGVLSPGITLGAAVAGALVLLLYRRSRSRAARLGAALSGAAARLHAQISEGLTALRIIKSLGREAPAERQNAAALRELRGAQMAYAHSAGAGQAALEGGGALLLAVLVWLALMHWHTPTVIILPMIALCARALPLLGALQLHWQNWAHAQPALAAAQDLLRRTEAAREPGGEVLPAPALDRAITLEAVTVRFAPEAPPALDAVSLTIGAFETVMIAGPSGAGKSTLADLLGGLISPDAGQVRVDDVPLTGAARRGWRGRVAYVQQDPVLFSATLRENLLWADPLADNARLEAALAAASAGFVHHLPLGLDTRIGEGGRRLSGGERQRIVLARALLRAPALLILDEATSALDDENQTAVVTALAGLKGRLAMVIIGHSGPLAALADRTVVLESGRISPR
jgi:ATP-binding cassette subfamily C protein